MSPGKKTVRARKRNGFTSRVDFVKALQDAGYEISESRIGRLERDEKTHFSILELQAIARILREDMDDLFNNDGSLSPSAEVSLDQLAPDKRRVAILLINELDKL